MTSFLFIQLLLLLVLLSSIYCDDTSIVDTLHQRFEMRKRIAFGESVKPGEAPYQVALREGTFIFCGGTLIGPRHVITAAHCVTDMVIAETVVTAGLFTVTVCEAPCKSVNIAEVIQHEEYDPSTLANDIAILVLAEPILEVKDIIEYAVPAVAMTPVGTIMMVSGYGRTQSQEQPLTLQRMETPVLEKSMCPYIINETMICSGPGDGRETCPGDSGGPIVIRAPKDYRRTLVGIVSYGYSTVCSNGLPVVFTNVSNYQSWLEEKIQLELFTCNNIESTSQSVCSGKGVCLSNGECVCYPGVSGPLCQTGSPLSSWAWANPKPQTPRPPYAVWGSTVVGSDSAFGSIDTGSDNSVYGVGMFSGSAKIGQFSFPSSPTDTPFITKYSKTGQVLWALTLGIATIPTTVKVLPDKGIIVGGFKEGGGIFITKYSETGQKVWSLSSSGGASTVLVIAAAPDSSIFIAGNVEGTFIKFGSKSVSVPGEGFFIARINKSGVTQWIKGGTGSIGQISIGLRKRGILYISGTYSTSMRYGTVSYNPPSFFLASFLLSIDSLGRFRFINRMDGVFITNIVVGDAVFLTGIAFPTTLRGTGGTQADYNVAGLTCILAKYDGSGRILFVKPVVGSSMTVGLAFGKTGVFVGFASQVGRAGVAKMDFNGNKIWISAPLQGTLSDISAGIDDTVHVAGRAFASTVLGTGDISTIANSGLVVKFSDIPHCYGISQKSSSVCSGNGVCEITGKCKCKAGFLGPTCKK